MYLWIFVTAPNKMVAAKISSHLLKKKLIACANMFPVKSAYWWKTKINRSSEIAILMKTTKTKKKRVFHEIKKNHPYELPDLTSFEVDSPKDVVSWIKSSLK